MLIPVVSDALLVDLDNTLVDRAGAFAAWAEAFADERVWARGQRAGSSRPTATGTRPARRSRSGCA